MPARNWFERFRGRLITAAPVIVETCHFLGPAARIELLSWASGGGVAVVDVPVSAYPALAAIIRKFADHDIDFADAALAWLAGETGVRRILTVDMQDFSALRVRSGKRFEIVDWGMV